jgi:hypothetical protein
MKHILLIKIVGSKVVAAQSVRGISVLNLFDKNTLTEGGMNFYKESKEKKQGLLYKYLHNQFPF